MATQIDSSSEKLATFEDLYNILSGYLTCSLGYTFDTNIFKYGAKLLAGDETPNKLVRRADANSCGFCVNLYTYNDLVGPTYNLSGTTYTGYLLVQLRDLLPDHGTEQTIDGLYAFCKNIDNVTLYLANGGTLLSYNLQTALMGAGFWTLSTVEYMLSTSNLIDYSHWDEYTKLTDNLFTIGRVMTGSSSYKVYTVLNKNIGQGHTDITLPICLGSNKEAVNSQCTISEGSSGAYLTLGSNSVYLNLYIRMNNLEVLTFNINLSEGSEIRAWNTLDSTLEEISHESTKLTRT